MARSFDSASSEYLNVSSVCGVTAEPVVIACLFKTADTTSTMAMVSIGDTGVDNSYFRLACVAGNIRMQVRHPTGGTFTADSTTAYSANTWHWAIGQMTTGTRARAFLDGGSMGESGTGATFPSGLDTTAIGRLDRASPTNYFDGEIAEVFIISENTGQARMGEMFSSTLRHSALFHPHNLLCYWPLGGMLDADDGDRDIWAGNDMSDFNTPTTADHPTVLYPSAAQLGIDLSVAGPAGADFPFRRYYMGTGL